MELSTQPGLRDVPSDAQVISINGTGSEKNLFCIHAADGGVQAYLELANMLSGEIDVYGISAFDFDGKTPFPPTVNAAAASYADKIQRLQPSGPYLLLGFSLGGQIAFEIARELFRRGHETEIFVLDSHPPSNPLATSPETDKTEPPLRLRASTLAQWTFFVILNSVDRVPLVPKSFWGLSDAEKCEFLLNNRHDTTMFRENCELWRANSAEDVSYMFDLMRQQFGASWEYRADAYDGCVNYIKCINRDAPEVREYAERIVLAFWRHIPASQVTVTWLEGSHDAALRAPGIDATAGLIRQRSGQRLR